MVNLILEIIGSSQKSTLLHLQRMFLFSIILCSVIVLTTTMLSIVDLCFLPAVYISDILLRITSFCVFLIFSYIFDTIFTKNKLLWLLLSSSPFPFYQLILLCLAATVTFSCSILLYSTSRFFIISSPPSIKQFCSSSYFISFFPFCHCWYCLLDHAKCYFFSSNVSFLFHYTFKHFLDSLFWNCLYCVLWFSCDILVFFDPLFTFLLILSAILGILFLLSFCLFIMCSWIIFILSIICFSVVILCF